MVFSKYFDLFSMRKIQAQRKIQKETLPVQMTLQKSDQMAS